MRKHVALVEVEKALLVGSDLVHSLFLGVGMGSAIDTAMSARRHAVCVGVGHWWPVPGRESRKRPGRAG